jgi:hypothetical protein
MEGDSEYHEPLARVQRHLYQQEAVHAESNHVHRFHGRHTSRQKVFDVSQG